ncbi:hypothetical protein SAY87_022239 [Trapa incisa]|uniref:Uncharacterized protein n=1 Tax=Trapa incisa TaxID=236973 RepID=A0AAN7JSN8_9MYRT|nr:hypothetical protein SAY87_022239 [Trapa incisa]
MQLIKSASSRSPSRIFSLLLHRDRSVSKTMAISRACVACSFLLLVSVPFLQQLVEADNLTESTDFDQLQKTQSKCESSVPCMCHRLALPVGGSGTASSVFEESISSFLLISYFFLEWESAVLSAAGGREREKKKRLTGSDYDYAEKAEDSFHLGRSAWAKTREERSQRLTMVRREGSSFSNGNKPMEPSDASDREEELRTVVGRKRLKLPRKFLEDCYSVKQASVPRKLRSAMKKPSWESPLLSMPSSKKPKYLIQGGESPKKDSARRTKKHGISRMAFSGLISKDEEEAVEALYSLAGARPTCSSRAGQESAGDDTSAIPGEICTTDSAFEAAEEQLKCSAPSHNEERLCEENGGSRSPNEPISDQEPKLLDLEPFREADRGAETILQAASSHSCCENHELHASCNVMLAAEPTLDSRINQPAKTDMLPLPRKEEQKEVSVHTNQLDLNHKIEDSQSRETGSGECWLPIEKVPKRSAHMMSEKKCVKHVFISHLIRTLQMSLSKDEPVLHPRLNVLQDISNQVFAGMISSDSSRNLCGARNVTRQKIRHSQRPKLSFLKNEGCNFSSLSNSIGEPNQTPSPSYLHSVAQQQIMSMSLPTSKTYYSHSYPDQLSGFTASHQMPSYLGNSGRLLLHGGTMVFPKEKRHQQMVWAGQLASAHFEPMGSMKAIAQLSSGESMGAEAAAWIKRAEIDTRAPFRSVREAVSLFADRVIAGEVYARSPKDKAKYKYVDNGEANNCGGGALRGNEGDVSAELEETRQRLRKAREEGLLMESCLSSLKEELERTKQELLQLKTNTTDFSSSSSPSSLKHPTTEEEEESDEIAEHVKFMEDRLTNRLGSLELQGLPPHGTTGSNSGAKNSCDKVEFQKKRYVTFASPPSLDHQVVVVSESSDSILQRHPSLRQEAEKKHKKNKKPLIPLIGAIFSRNKRSHPVARHQFS